VKIEWLDSISGTVHGDPLGKKRGQVDEVSDELGQRLIEQGLAQANWKDEPGPAYQPSERCGMVKTKGPQRVWEG
jgi:hypothetical protein